ncbi:hypothetical protein [Aquimarina algiphila]|uniref:hypothetical protein n=1 Tax=Aquimarina algiphila TaxID=2047982 RepID=UPI00248F8E77|nr:hypothetical protein [Aquimarina algiphila]
MNILIKTLLILILFIPKGLAQTKGDIKNIKEEYSSITKLLEQDKLTALALENKCNSNGQTEAFLTFYYNNDNLVHIQHTYAEGHSNYTNHYYINDNKLFFYFSEHESWRWDYEGTPKEQGFTNEIWTYDEQRIYFVKEVPIKCLRKAYTEKSVDQPNKGETTLSEAKKNKEVDCDKNSMKLILKKYQLLLTFQKSTTQNICDISFE